MPQKYIRIIIVATLLSVTAVLLGIAYVNSDTSTQSASNSSISSLTPTPGGLHNPRGDVIVDLVTGLDARLVINGIVIPDDEIIAVESESLFTFRPQAGKVIESFDTGINTAEVIFWPQGEPEPSDAERYSWEFKVT